MTAEIIDFAEYRRQRIEKAFNELMRIAPRLHPWSGGGGPDCGDVEIRKFGPSEWVNPPAWLRLFKGRFEK
jgi:hypothetical protein